MVQDDQGQGSHREEGQAGTRRWVERSTENHTCYSFPTGQVVTGRQAVVGGWTGWLLSSLSHSLVSQTLDAKRKDELRFEEPLAEKGWVGGKRLQGIKTKT